MRNIKRFIIVSYGRTGSTYLVRELGRHPDIKVAAEVFHNRKERRPVLNGRIWEEEESPLDFVNDNLFNRNDIAEGVRGLKLFYFHAQSSVGNASDIWSEIALNSNIFLIFPHRRNIFASHVSEVRARSSMLWHPNNQPAYQELQEIYIDPDHAKRYIMKIRDYETFRYNLDEKRGYLEVYYEDLEISARATLRKVTNHLGIDELPYEPAPFEAGSAHANKTHIKNINEVRQVLIELEAEWMLEPYERGSS